MFKNLIIWILKLRKTNKRKRSNLKPTSFKLGVFKDSVDQRDYICKLEPSKVNFPLKIDYSKYVPDIKNQLSIGSCGSHTAITGIETLFRMKKVEWYVQLSEMYHYWLVRQKEYENTFPADSGQTGRNAMKIVNQIGACPEIVYPYIVTKFNDGPGMKEFAKSISKYWKVSQYERCFDIDSIKKALLDKKLVWLGVPVTNSIFSYKEGIYGPKGEPFVGGHAMLIVGYDDEKKAFKVANSWGTSWGQKGFGYISYDYITSNIWFDAWAFDILI